MFKKIILVLIMLTDADCNFFSNEKFLIDKLSSINYDLYEAAAEIVTNNFESSATRINFIMALNDDTKYNHRMPINNLILKCKLPVHIEDIQFIYQRHRLYNVIFIDNFQSFSQLFRQMSSDTFAIDGFYLVILVSQGPIKVINKIAVHFWSIFIHNIDFLFVADNGIVNLLTIIPFHHGKCNDTTPIVINQFRNGKFLIETNNFPEKMKNLHGCPIKVVTFNCPPMMMIQYLDDDNTTYELSGTDGLMLHALSQAINFKIDLHHLSDVIR